MCGKLNKEDGFLLIESLLGLSLMTMGLVILLPAAASFSSLREQKRIEVEMHRLMYDSALAWNGEDDRTENVRYGEWEFIVSTTGRGVTLTGPKAVSGQMELKKIEFQK